MNQNLTFPVSLDIACRMARWFATWLLTAGALLFAERALADVISVPVTADTYITSGAPNNNAGGHGWIDAGTDGPFGGNANRRALLRFDLSTIPAGVTVTSAVLKLTAVQIPSSGPVDSTFDLFRLQASWGEGNKIGNSGAPAGNGEATWNARLQGTANWTAPGAASDAIGVPSGSTPVGSTFGATYNWGGTGVVADVQFWLANPAQNFGWLLKSRAEGTSRSVRGFGSSEGASPGSLEIGFATLENQAPTVSITNPAPGGSFTAGVPVTIEAAASDADGTVVSVEFFDGATSLGLDSTAPFGVTATLYTGAHLLTAVATDNSGATAVSGIITNTGITIPISDPIAERIPAGDVVIELQTIADGFAAPLGMASPVDGSGRKFVYDQEGRVWVVAASGRLAEPLLDVRGRMVQLGAYDERGLLGFAIHPGFATNGLVYSYTSEPYSGPADFENGLGTNNNHQSVIAEWRISAGNSNIVDMASRREVLRIDQPQSNHNGGAMHFGPDGYLYVVLGDGGSANDVATGHVPGGNAQNINRIWGKLIRIDVDGSTSANGQYGLPADNPFVGTDGLDEIWAYGLRNPFSFGFERGTGTLYLADVGQNRVEEINTIIKGGNFGWNTKEGTFWFDGAGAIVTAPVRPVPPDLVDPIAEYDHDDGLAVISGFVYHGGEIAELSGRFVFGDWGSFSAPSGRLFYLDATNGVKELKIGLEDRPLGLWLRGYGEDTAGELYVFCSSQLGPAGSTGRMMKLVSAPGPLMMSGGVSIEGTNVVTSWTGGGGTVALQKSADLRNPAWANEKFTTGSSASASASGEAGFFRAFDASHIPPIPFTAQLSGAAERPNPNASTATGLGIFRLDGNTLAFSLRYQGLSAAASAAHIHGPAGASTAGNVLIDLAPYNGGAWGTNGTLSGVLVLNDAQKALVLSGQTYVNVHTPAFPNGEIRGQIAPVNFEMVLRGDKNNPTIPADAGGLGNLVLAGNQLTFNVTYQNLSGAATAAHIHGPAAQGEIANVLINLAAYNGGGFGTNGSLSGTVSLNPTELAYLLDGLTYINIHTPANTGGEIRGQILSQTTAVPLTAILSGLGEHPALTNSASGSGTFSLENDMLTFNVRYAGLSGVAIAAHIHGYTNTTADAPVLVNLAPFNGGGFGSSGALSGRVKLTREQRNGLLAGLTYLNVHTLANGGGELRGQIAPVSLFASLSGVNERPAAIATPGGGYGAFALIRDQLALSVTYRDLLSSATASHIHGPASLFQSGNVLQDLGGLNGGGYGISGALSGTVQLPFNALQNVIDLQTYVNVHTTNNPAGEIRGQILH